MVDDSDNNNVNNNNDVHYYISSMNWFLIDAQYNIQDQRVTNLIVKYNPFQMFIKVYNVTLLMYSIFNPLVTIMNNINRELNEVNNCFSKLQSPTISLHS